MNSVQPDARCASCAAPGAIGELTLTIEKRNPEGAFAFVVVGQTYLLCSECFGRLALLVRETAAGEARRTNGPAASCADAAWHRSDAHRCTFCASEILAEATGIQFLPLGGALIRNRHQRQLTTSIGQYRLCATCVSWLLGRVYLQGRSTRSRASWLFTSVLNATAIGLSDPDAAQLRRTVESMGGRCRVATPTDLASLDPAQSALFVACDASGRGSRALQALPRHLLERVILVAGSDAIAEMSTWLRAGVRDFVVTPLTPQAIAGAIDRVAFPVRGARHGSGLTIPNDRGPRYGLPCQTLRIAASPRTPLLLQTLSVRQSVRGYDVVGATMGGDIAVLLYCEEAYVAAIAQRLRFVLRSDAIDVVAKQGSEAPPRVVESGHLMLVPESGGEVVGSGIAGLPYPGPARDGLPRILYIEDTLYSLRLLDDALGMAGGVQLLTATSGERGLELAREELPDLVFLDLHLPDMHGLEVLAQLKADRGDVAAIPVIVLTADATRATRTGALAAGASDFVTKPLDIKDFLGKLPRWLALAAPRRAAS